MVRAALLALAAVLGTVHCARDAFGVPYANDSVVQAHLDSRAQWIAAEKTQRQGDSCHTDQPLLLGD